MSIGAGTPKFRIWLTMSAGRKREDVPGKLPRQPLAQRRARSPPSARGRGFSEIRMSASLLPTVPELP